MKTFTKIMAIAALAVFSIASCINASAAEPQLFGKKSAAYTSGQTTGAALKALYAQYKADGKKLDMKNAKNLLSLASLATSISGLKDTTKDSSFYKEFATGMVAGSSNLVTTGTSDNVMSSLTTLAGMDLSAIAGKSSTASGSSTSKESNISEIASNVSGILGLFKK
ncbi:MAG: hypothetical protein NC308_10560 [Clostridium sp.]|nr:hypothetical protein [Bacteroides sp.]MCM1199316.1 hypothetical protein [Clostridium sp.]